MQNERHNAEPPCLEALEHFENAFIHPNSDQLPHTTESDRTYIPKSVVTQYFADAERLKSLFLCNCGACTRDGGPVHAESGDDRTTYWTETRREQLQGEYMLIYALLIYIRRAGLIRTFQRRDLMLNGTSYIPREHLDALRGESLHNVDSLIKQVLRRQYNFSVRVLEPNLDLVNISPKELLPIDEESEPRGQGAFARVWCFGFQSEEYRSRKFGDITRFARKIPREGLTPQSIKEWVTHLQLTSKIRNEAAKQHVMQALGAYSHGDIFFILQEEADRSLHDYLFHTNHDRYDSAELWQQIEGLSRGLAALHNLYHGTKRAYHQDLKPANILVVRGIMKIADFGLVEFRPVTVPGPGDSDISGVESNLIMGHYRAPGERSTRQGDIWSLGCIISELTTSDIQSLDAIQQYRSERRRDTENLSGSDEPKFFNSRGVVKNSVLEWHKKLRDHVRNTEDGSITEFQKRFYSDQYFVLLNSMFRHRTRFGNTLEVPSAGDLSIINAPMAEQIASDLKRLREEALAPPPPPNAPYRRRELPDIWREIHNETLAGCPSNPRNRFAAVHIKNPQDIKCGLWVSDNPDHTLVTINQTTVELQDYDVTWRLEPNKIRRCADTKFFSDYQEHASAYGSLYHAHCIDNSFPETTIYGFREKRDFLLFQATVTGQYPYLLKSYSLQDFSLRKEHKIFKRVRTESAPEPVEVQLWTFEPHLPLNETIFHWRVRGKPICHLAVMSPEATYLIRIDFDFRPPEISGHAGSYTELFFRKKEVVTLSGRGIGTRLEEPTGTTQTWTEVRLRFKQHSDAQNFLRNTRELHQEWKDKVNEKWTYERDT